MTFPGRLLKRAAVTAQYLLPHHLLSAMVHGMARWRWKPFKNSCIGLFVRLAGVDLAEAKSPDPDDYPDFAAFFTRALRPGCRPVPDDPRAVLSPVDGILSQIGQLEGEQILQAKGIRYHASRLLADPDQARRFDGGHFATLYLAPHQYHRVHMPVDGTLSASVYVPGRLFSVANYTAERIPGLFLRNERLVCFFETPAGFMAQVLVGAMLVSCIETVWDGEIERSRMLRTRDFTHEAPSLARGAEMGRFNMGSTVILLFPAGRIRWREELGPGTGLRQGEAMGNYVS